MGIITHRIGKPKICDNCCSEFKNNKSLKNHKAQDKTVSCRRCNKIFIGSCPLQRHIKYEHDTKNEPIPPLQRQYTGRQNYNRAQTTKVIITKPDVPKAATAQNSMIKTEPTDWQKPPAKKAKVVEKLIPQPKTLVKNERPEVTAPSTINIPIISPSASLAPVTQEFFIPP